MNIDITRELLNEIERKSFQIRAIADGMASMGDTVCRESDASAVCFTGTDPEKAFQYMAETIGDLQQQISEHVSELFKNLPKS